MRAGGYVGRYLPSVGLSLVLVLATPVAAQTSMRSAELDAAVRAFEARDYLDAFAKLKPLADAGDPDAAMRLATMFEHGLGVPKNRAEASRLRGVASVSQAATQDPQLQAGLKAARQDDPLEAFAKLKPLADGGDPVAQLALGDLFADGRGVPQNLTEARRLYGLAAGDGSAVRSVAQERLQQLAQAGPRAPRAASEAPSRVIPAEAGPKTDWGRVLLGVAVIGGIAYLAAKSGGGGGSYPPSNDYSWRWDEFYDEWRNLTWRCRGVQTGEFADNYRCAGQLQVDTAWPGK